MLGLTPRRGRDVARWSLPAGLALGGLVALVLLVRTVDSHGPPTGNTTYPVAPAPGWPGAPVGDRPQATKTFGPTADLDAVLNSLKPGDVAGLASGVYSARGRTTDWTASGTAAEPIVVEPLPGARVTVLGHTVIRASHVRVDGLVFAGPTGPVAPANRPNGEEFLVGIYGHDVALTGCEVRDDAWHAGIYTVGNDVTISRCWVHDNGDRSQPDQANLDQGIYYGGGYGGRIVANLLEHNYAYGLQIYPSARSVLVKDNVIVRNGSWSRTRHGGGVAWEGDTTNVLLVGNVIAFNDGWDIHTDGRLRGARNVARANVSYRNTAGTWNDAGGVTLERNTSGVDPCSRLMAVAVRPDLAAACPRVS